MKGRQARQESADGSIILFDRASKVVYHLNTAQRTYWSVSFPDALSAGSRLPGPMANRMSLDVKTGMMEIKDDPNRTVAHWAVTGFLLEANAQFSPQGPSGRGGFPGSGNGFPPPGAPAAPPRFTLNAEWWLADGVSVLGVEQQDVKDLSFALLAPLLPESSPFTRALTDRLKGRVPLEGSFLIQQPGRPPRQPGNPPPQPGQSPDALPEPPSPDNANGNSGGNPAAPEPENITVSFTTRSIESGLTLDDALFTVPSDLQRVNPPRP